MTPPTVTVDPRRALRAQLLHEQYGTPIVHEYRNGPAATDLLALVEALGEDDHEGAGE